MIISSSAQSVIDRFQDRFSRLEKCRESIAQISGYLDGMGLTFSHYDLEKKRDAEYKELVESSVSSLCKIVSTETAPPFKIEVNECLYRKRAWEMIANGKFCITALCLSMLEENDPKNALESHLRSAAGEIAWRTKRSDLFSESRSGVTFSFSMCSESSFRDPSKFGYSFRCREYLAKEIESFCDFLKWNDMEHAAVHLRQLVQGIGAYGNEFVSRQTVGDASGIKVVAFKSAVKITFPTNIATKLKEFIGLYASQCENAA